MEINKSCKDRKTKTKMFNRIYPILYFHFFILIDPNIDKTNEENATIIQIKVVRLFTYV